MSDDLKRIRGKPGAFLFAGVFAVCFGGVGAFASWVIGKTLWDAWQAGSWARVLAQVIQYEGGNVQYSYEFDERTFLGRRIGIAALETDEGNPATSARIQQALNDKTPLEVLVDPDEPSQSVIDTTIPWAMMIGFLPFAIGFGAVGLGALAVMVATVLPARVEDEEEHINSDAAAGFLGLAFFTLLWNSIAFPIAAVMVVELWASGEWLGLLVLLFPLVGLLMVWGTINAGIAWLRRGGATLHPQQMPPRLGGAFSGHVSFKRGVAAGETYKVALSCTTAGGKDNPAITTHWKGEQPARVSDVGGRRRLTFRFDPPDRLPGFERDAQTQWSLNLFPEGKTTAAFTFPFKMQPPAGVEHMSEEELRGGSGIAVDEDDSLVPAGVPRQLEGVAALVGRERIEEKIAQMPAADRARLHARLEQMTRVQKEALAQVGKYAHYAPLVKKLVFWLIGLLILVHVIGVVSVSLFSS